MPIIIPAFLMAILGTVSYNVETCLGDGPDNVQEAHYCKQLAANDLEAESFDWLKGFGATIAVGN